MQLECPQCRRRVPLAPPESPDAGRRMTCPHCRAPLMLDQFAGRLAAVKKAPVSDRAPQISRPVSAARPGGFIGSRRSSGRDTLAAVFVAACLAAIMAGGLRLAVGFHFEMGQTEKAFQDAEDACRLGFEKACALLKRYDRKTGS